MPALVGRYKIILMILAVLANDGGNDGIRIDDDQNREGYNCDSEVAYDYGGAGDGQGGN